MDNIAEDMGVASLYCVYCSVTHASESSGLSVILGKRGRGLVESEENGVPSIMAFCN